MVLEDLVKVPMALVEQVAPLTATGAAVALGVVLA